MKVNRFLIINAISKDRILITGDIILFSFKPYPNSEWVSVDVEISPQAVTRICPKVPSSRINGHGELNFKSFLITCWFHRLKRCQPERRLQMIINWWSRGISSWKLIFCVNGGCQGNNCLKENPNASYVTAIYFHILISVTRKPDF